MALAVSTMAHGASLLCRSYTKRWRKRPNPARKPSSDRIAEFSAWLPENCWIHLTERLDTAQPGNKSFQWRAGNMFSTLAGHGYKYEHKDASCPAIPAQS